MAGNKIMTAQVTWDSGMRFIGEADSGHAIVLDSDPEVGGRDTGIRSMELLLVGLIGCTAMDVAYILRRKRQPFTSLTVSAKGIRADNHPQVFKEVHIEYRLSGEGLSEKAVRQAIELSQNKYCAASAMFRETANVTYSFSINGQGA
jgi:putative redox protein